MHFLSAMKKSSIENSELLKRAFISWHYEDLPEKWKNRFLLGISSSRILTALSIVIQKVELTE